MIQDKIQSLLLRLFYLDKNEFYKMLIGGTVFFAVIGAYTLFQELKYGVFSAIVGPHLIPIAKLLAFSILIPSIMLDGYLVDRFKRYQLLMLYTAVFGVIGMIFTFLFAHPEIGIANLKKDVWRIFGWVFFVYVESFSVFILGVFWAFLNSVHDPKNARNTYAFIVSFSKVGGIFVTVCAYVFLAKSNFFNINMSSTSKIQVVMFCASSLLLFIPFFLHKMIKKLNLDAFKGYNVEVINEEVQKTGMLAGVRLLVKNKYVFGIFLLVFLGDVVSEVVNYKRILNVVSSKTAQDDLSHTIAELYMQLMYMHSLGLLFSMIFTNSIMRLMNPRICVLIMPVMTLSFAFAYVVTSIDEFITWLYIVIKASYYTIGTPVRETLYIISSKDIQFKSKFVIDALGLKFARNTAQGFNYMTHVMGQKYGQYCAAFATNTLLLTLPLIWIVVAYFIGRKYVQTVKDNKVIS